jgi:homocitrate synthase NifV
MGGGETDMKKRLTIADHTVNRAVSPGLPVTEIKRIIQTLQKYPVGCFEMDTGVLEEFPFIRTLLPENMIRYNVNAGEWAQETGGIMKVRMNCTHQKGMSLEALCKTADSAALHELYLGLENAGEMDAKEFALYFEWALKYSVRGIIYCCGGTEDVLCLAEKLTWVKNNAPCSVEFDGLNTIGLATAQSLAALKAGITCVSASVAGMFGYTPMEEILMSAKHLWQYDIPQGKELAADFQTILSLLGIKTPATKVMIGPDVFAHESGIHVDGIIKNPAIYEVIRPEDVGLKRKLVIGKHSGTASLKSKVLQWGFQLSNDEAVCLLESVRELAQLQKGPLSDQQLKDLFSSGLKWRKS